MHGSTTYAQFRAALLNNSKDHAKPGISDWAVKKAFQAHKSQSKRRGIGFELTIEQWWALWGPHWLKRRELNLCMGRHGDVGPYAFGNVAIITRKQNRLDAILNARKRREAVSCH